MSKKANLNKFFVFVESNVKTLPPVFITHIPFSTMEYSDTKWKKDTYFVEKAHIL